MSLDSVFTVLALLIAVIAIIPNYKFKYLMLKSRIIDWIIIVLAVLVVLYLQFYLTFYSWNLTPQLGLYNKFYLTQYNISFIVVFVLGIYVSLRIKFSKIPRRKFYKIRKLINDYSVRHKFNEIIIMLKENDKQFNDICSKYLRIRKNSVSSFPFPVKKISQKSKHDIKYYKEINLMFYDLLRNDNLIKILAYEDPYFAIRILNLKLDYKQRFIDIFLRFLYKNNSSILYAEIEKNQNFDTNLTYNVYALPESNVILNYMFKEKHIAYNLSVWFPIGQEMLSELDRLQLSDNEEDYYNLPMYDYYDNSKWKSSLYVGIEFFNIMVNRALYNNTLWHMWMFYYGDVVTKILRNYKKNEKYENESDEWPTKYHYLIYSIISNCCDWILLIRDLPLGQENIKITDTTNANGNGNIPISAIKLLGSCVYRILYISVLGEKFNHYIMDIVFSLYFELRADEKLVKYAEILKKSLKLGFFHMDPDPIYLASLKAELDNHDKLHYDAEHIKELEEYFKAK